MLGEKLGIVNKRISKQSKSRGANVIVRSIVKREFKKRGMQRRASFAEGVEGGEKPQSNFQKQSGGLFSKRGMPCKRGLPLVGRPQTAPFKGARP